jgi:putative flavoprotein involved in K+ transport
MRHIDTIIIGGGQAGLAMSRSLGDRGIEHVVLERGGIGERWRSERWDSLRLLTPRWQARLPGWSYDGPDPDGYMGRTEVIDYLVRYADSFGAPIETGVTVTSVARHPLGFRVDTSEGSWTSSNVVLATGDCDTPYVPPLAEGLSPRLHQVVPSRYKNPAQLPKGGVLVVGASATGIQLASEIHASGRPVTLSVARHTRMPRTYRGRDILYWLDTMGVFDERADAVQDLETSRSQPSLQLIGTPDRRTIDLGVLMAEGIRLVGSTASTEGTSAAFADDLIETTVAADVKLARTLIRIDRFIASSGLEAEAEPAEPFVPIRAPDAPTSLDLQAEGIRTVLWATGFKREYPWLHIPILDGRGEIRHRGGVTPDPGLYVMGLRFLRRRNSSFIDGQAKDAVELADHILARRGQPSLAIA